MFGVGRRDGPESRTRTARRASSGLSSQNHLPPDLSHPFPRRAWMCCPGDRSPGDRHPERRDPAGRRGCQGKQRVETYRVNAVRDGEPQVLGRLELRPGEVDCFLHGTTVRDERGTGAQGAR
jgi:hypothetical protein